MNGQARRRAKDTAAEPDANPELVVLRKRLGEQFWLRFHMSVMLTATFVVGFLVNFALLRWPVHHATLRWPLAMVAGYATLFCCMRLWLAYVGVRPFTSGSARQATDSGADVLANSPWPVGGGGSSTGEAFKGGGGSFGGGGASASFDAPSGSGGGSGGARGLLSTGSSGARGGAKVGGGFAIGDVFGEDLGKVLLLIAIVLALIAALLGGVVYMVALAPSLLVDVAFGAIVTSGIAPAARRVAHTPDWEGSVLRATWKPFALVMVAVVACALAFEHFFPGARTLGEAWMALH